MTSKPIYGVALMLVASVGAGCGGSRGDGGCLVPASLPAFVGTPIPPQPIPQNAGVTTSATVVVSVVVDSSGNVVSDAIKTSSGNAVIDSAALTLVRNSKFIPGNRGCGTRTPNTTTVTVSFSPTA